MWLVVLRMGFEPTEVVLTRFETVHLNHTIKAESLIYMHKSMVQNWVCIWDAKV